MSKRAILNKVAALIERRAKNTATGMSFRIELEGSEPEIYRTRGFNEQQCNQSQPTQTTEDSTND